MNENIQESQNEISLLDLYIIVRKNIILILTSTLLFAVIAGLYAFLIADETYSANADVMVQVQTDPLVEGSYDYNTASKVMETIVEFMSKDIVLKEVIDELDLEYTTKQIRSNLSINSSNTSYFINIEYVDEDPRLAQDVVNSIIDHSITIANDNDSFSSLRNKITRTSSAEEFYYHAPNKILYVAIGIILGGITGLGIVFIKELMHNSFKSKEQLETAFDIQVLGVIPEFEVKEDF